MAQSKSRKEEGAETGPRPPGSRAVEGGGAQQPDLASGQRTYDHAIRSSSPGIARSRVSRSTARSCSATGFTSNSGTTPQPRSIWARRGAPSRLRGGRCRPAQPGTRRPAFAASRRTPSRGPPGELAHAEQGRRLLDTADADHPARTPRSRDVGGAHRLRPSTGRVAGAAARSIQQREEHWVIADSGRQGRTRPHRAHPAVGQGRHRCVDDGRRHHRRAVFRAINKAGRVWGDGMSPKVLWDVVRGSGRARRHRQAGPARSAPHRAPGCVTWRVANSTDPVPTRPRLRPDHGALPRMQAEAPMRRERSDGHRTGRDG